MLTPKVGLFPFMSVHIHFQFLCVYIFDLYLYLDVKLYLPGVHAVLKTGKWVRYCIFDLATGKAEQENNFPTSNLAFLGQSERNVAIFTAGQVRSFPK